MCELGRRQTKRFCVAEGASPDGFSAAFSAYLAEYDVADSEVPSADVACVWAAVVL